MAAAAMKFAQQHSPLMCVRGHAQNISMSCVNKGATLVLLFALAAFYILLNVFVSVWMETLLCTQIIMREAWGRKARGERSRVI